jgi:alcohol dehydrogenase YqhD (iron-dependent ADH family)
MHDFVYYTPTKIIFGKNTEQQCGGLVKAQKCRKVMIHYGGQSALRSGLVDRIKASLEAEGLAYVTLGGVVPNPRISLIRQGIELARSEGVDFVLAVGGGSVIDSAKGIAYGAVNEGDVCDFYMAKRKPNACLPIGCVVTIAAAGSEMSSSSVVTNEENGFKRSCKTDMARPAFAIMNPELTLTLPAFQTACGCVDILMHTMERYFGHGSNMDITDSISEGLLRTVMHHATVLHNDPANYESRAEVMWAGSLSHNGLTGCGSDGGDWATHMIEHELSGMFDVAHGAGLSAIWGSWARHVLSNRPDRFALFAERVMGVARAESDTATGLRGIEVMEDFFRSLDMPTSLKELDLAPTDAQLAEMAEKALVGKSHIGSVKKLLPPDIVAIFADSR